MTRGTVHHLEIWLPDEAATHSWIWLLTELGYVCTSRWPEGSSWSLGATYLVLEHGPDVIGARAERRQPGLNHLAFDGGTRAEVEALTVAAGHHGWTLMFAHRHPWAGGDEHYAAYLEDARGFEVEIVAQG
ncbi:glyoxalase [Ruania alba]|uniref:VOC domain-containing protein n=1 Tax=Ruania alba TaxID=648782 RepID=A0A1H5N3I1_9MICO|nr:glyoxalase [Ruania alba]SEE96144.1 hypothetical protein SAMN04488554_3904 [Ruania alba]